MYTNRYLTDDEADNLYDLYGPTGPALLNPVRVMYATNDDQDEADRGEGFIGARPDGVKALMVIVLNANRPTLYFKAVLTPQEGLAYARWYFTGPRKAAALLAAYGFTTEVL